MTGRSRSNSLSPMQGVLRRGHARKEREDASGTCGRTRHVHGRRLHDSHHARDACCEYAHISEPQLGANNTGQLTWARQAADRLQGQGHRRAARRLQSQGDGIEVALGGGRRGDFEPTTVGPGILAAARAGAGRAQPVAEWADQAWRDVCLEQAQFCWRSTRKTRRPARPVRAVAPAYEADRADRRRGRAFARRDDHEGDPDAEQKSARGST
jgi:hypothetical protein